ncbi:chloride channel protein [Pleomorphomonas carboxyditropha]|uniref:Chloride channel protein n=1 Tax=Pleomorphomonas carboxyditropha TaxID=2023338 RepID=A0A2G9X104_9HYPH|nr:chloride channel protein [Pleomorphomonas carboxyditropha]PIP00626.1 chloride channel protein [Pleomorphomonas carboxyditropha]
MPRLHRPKVYARYSRAEAAHLRRQMLFLAGGIGVGIAAVLMARAADLAQAAFRAGVAALPWLPLIVTPAGFALSCFLARRLFPGSQGSGIPQVIAARKLQPAEPSEHLVSLRIAGGKILLMLLGLLSGGALGREGPTVQVGAAIMQAAGRVASIRRSSLLLAGGAAGVAAAFNTPLAGIVFAIEELSRSFDSKASGIVIMTVMLAGLTAQMLLGDYTYFGSSYVTLAPGIAWIAVPMVAVVGGALGGLFNRLNVAWSRGLPGRAGAFVRRRPVVTAALLGLVVALLGFASGSDVSGTGYETARAAIHQTPADVGLWYGPAKLIATLASTLSGIPGGIFSPSLSIGAGLGLDVAHLLDVDAAPAIALLGMCAYLAGVVQAPLTSVVIVQEMTLNHAMLLPLMLVALIAGKISSLIAPEGVYHALARNFAAPAKADSPADSG